ncbi:MAG TPA: hypothetical protein PKE29_02365 [Phycisphaerales bacterium]|nr:hypothetical protein [Phycisphaerales bacterium]
MTSPSASRAASPDGLDDGTVALRDHITLLTGFPFKSEFYTEQPDGVRLVRGDNVVQGQLRWDNVKRWPLNRIDEAKGHELREGDVVLAMDRPWIEAGLKYARIGPDDVPSLLVQRVACLRAKDGLDQGYLFYLIGSHRFTDHVLSIQTGTAVPHISGPQILQFRYRPLPLDSQRAIAAVLGSLDDKIEQNRRTARALERLALAIFRAWFVDFEPVKAKAAGAASFPSMPQAVFDALPTTFVKSRIGAVPEGWDVGCVRDSATLSKAQIKPLDYPTEVFEHFSIPAFDAGCEPVAELGEGIKSGKFLVVRDCVLVSKLNPRIPRVWLPDEPGEQRQIASTEFLVLSPNDGWDSSYLYCQFIEPAFQDDLTQSASGTSNSHQRIQPSDYMNKAVVVPPAALREAFRDMISPMMGQIMADRRQSSTLAAVCDYLLPQLLSGRVPVESGQTGAEGTR